MKRFSCCLQLLCIAHLLCCLGIANKCEYTLTFSQNRKEIPCENNVVSLNGKLLDRVAFSECWNGFMEYCNKIVEMFTV